MHPPLLAPKPVFLLSFVLQYYPLEEILAAEYLLEDFRPDLIEMVLDKLRPEYVRLVRLVLFCFHIRLSSMVSATVANALSNQRSPDWLSSVSFAL